VGLARTKITGGESEGGLGLEYGAGARLWLSDAVGLRLEVRTIYSKAEPAGGGTVHLNDVVAGGGITFALGATPRDTDGDGVPTSATAAPTRRAARVDPPAARSTATATRCGRHRPVRRQPPARRWTPRLSERRRRRQVWDGIDQCAGTRPAPAWTPGVPERSGRRRVVDGIDQCPDTPRDCPVDDKGCPRTPTARVCDGRDQCPDTSPGSVDDKGCRWS